MTESNEPEKPDCPDDDGRYSATPVTTNSSRPGVLSVVQSVLAAMFGVQSHKKHDQDSQQGHIGDYVFTGVIMVVIFILTILWYVNKLVADYQAGL